MAKGVQHVFVLMLENRYQFVPPPPSPLKALIDCWNARIVVSHVAVEARNAKIGAGRRLAVHEERIERIEIHAMVTNSEIVQKILR